MQRPSGLGVPRWIVVIAVVGALFLVLPLVALIARVDWAHFIPLITSPSSIDALLLSLRTSVAATVLCIVLGVPMATVLARSAFPGQRVVRALVLLPLVLPPVVGGLALLYLFGRRGLLGGVLDVRLLDHCGRSGTDLRRPPVPRAEPGGRAPLCRNAVRGGRRHARRPSDAQCSCG